MPLPLRGGALAIFNVTIYIREFQMALWFGLMLLNYTIGSDDGFSFLYLRFQLHVRLYSGLPSAMNPSHGRPTGLMQDADHVTVNREEEK